MKDAEMDRVRQVARTQQLTVAEWVRQALRKAMDEQPVYRASKKIQVVREAARNTYPAGEIDDMLTEIEQGQQAGLDA